MRTTIAILLVACCLLGWWSLSNEPTLLPTETNADDAAEVVVATTKPDASTGTVQATTSRENVVSVNDYDNSLAPELPDDAKFVDVRIVMRETGEPVANAEIWWLNQLQHKLVRKFAPAKRPDHQDPDILAKTYGWRTRSDANGMIQIAPGKSQAEVLAEKDGLYGRATFTNDPPPRDGHTLEIELDLTLLVRVVTDGGKPARGVAIATTRHDPAQKNPSQRYWFERSIETDKHGIAAFPHMQLAQRTGARTKEVPVLQWLVHMRALGHDFKPVAVDAQMPPSEPVELRLPASGHLRVRIMSGQRGLPMTQVMLWPRPKKANKVPDYWQRHIAIRNVTDEKGWAEYRHVGLNKGFYIGSYEWEGEVDGPVQPDTTATATVNVDEHAIVLTGKLLTQDGESLASETCQITFHNDDGVIDQSMVHSAEDGAFLHIMAPGQKNMPRDRVRIEFQWDPEEAEGEATELAPRILHVGHTELGNVQLQAAILIVAGKIVTNGDVTTQCRMQIQEMQPPSKDDTPRWNWVYGANVIVDKELNFAAYGTLEPGRYRLQVFNPEFAPAEPVEFSVGARNVRIERHRGNQVTVHCLLPEALDGTRLKLRLQATEPNSSVRGPRHHSAAPGTADYSWKGLAAGTYALEIRPEGWGQTAPLRRIEGIQIPIDGNILGALPDINLRDSIASLEIEIAFANGSKDSAFVFLMPQQSDTWHGIMVSSGKVTLPVAPDATEVLVAAWQHQPVTVRAEAGRVMATLTHRPETDVMVVGLESIETDYKLTLLAHPNVKSPKDSRMFESRWGRNNLSLLLHGSNTSAPLKSGKGTLTLGDGPHRLELHVRHNKTRRSATLKGLNPNGISAGGNYQTQVDAAELAAAIEEVSKPREKKK
ncbi:MAG: hypothetical protein ACI9SE_003573 [Neolewinella sp.]|jgi:hypothetical protein